MAFVDEVTVFARGGKGGDGSAAVLREPYKPRGGPDGGDGGDGGDVVFEVSTGIHDLSALANDPHLRAAAGAAGGRNKRTGAAGADVVVQVPKGTRVEDEHGLVADLVEEASRAVIARGGPGGRGSVSLATARDRVPRVAEAGEPGEDRRLSVELRTVADVGLVGLPNAGKSTLLSVLTAARPKVADYPFTTLSPNLGVAESEDGRFVVADVPGLIEGASEGRGLGHRFLRHVTRSRALVLVIDLSAADPSADLATLRNELEVYDPDLVRRSSLVVGTKLDLVPDADPQGVLGAGAIGVSAVTGDVMPVLRERLTELAAESEAAAEAQQDYVVLRPARPRFVVRREGERYRVVGRGVERWVAESDLDDPRLVAQLQKRLVKEGVERELLVAGARRGDEVVIGSTAFEFLPGEEIADGSS
ncbi:MAG: GTPase ObgE [Actinomycetota bacterium]